MTVAESAKNGESATPLDPQQEAKLQELAQKDRDKHLYMAEKQIMSVEWGVTINLGNYESCRLSATANVWPGDDPEAILDGVQAWVAEHAPPSQSELLDLSRKREDYKAKLHEWEVKDQWLSDRLSAIKAWAKANGFNLPESYGEDLPF